MPRYDYACTACDHRFEAVQSFIDEPLTECPVCGDRLRKLISPVGVVFKGSGFYRNDSRPKEPAATGGGDSAKPAEKSDSATGSKKSDRTTGTKKSDSSSGAESAAGAKSDSKPAAASTAPPSTASKTA